MYLSVAFHDTWLYGVAVACRLTCSSCVMFSMSCVWEATRRFLSASTRTRSLQHHAHRYQMG